MLGSELRLEVIGEFKLIVLRDELSGMLSSSALKDTGLSSSGDEPRLSSSGMCCLAAAALSSSTP